MALIWSHEEDGNRYEVRSAGASLRLYRNGVNHSQWNPDRPLAGAVWDLITLPALYRPVGSLNDVLMLGFGAGAAARQLCDLAGVKRLVGVELDPMHLSIAQGFFDCDDRCELVAGDAVEWAYAADEAASFDLIIDDLYGEEQGIPVRCAPMDAEWFNHLVRLLRPGGILILNTIEPERIQQLPMLQNQALQARLPHAVMSQIDGYENRVLAFSDQPLVQQELESSLHAICRKYPRCNGVGKRYQFARL